MTALWNIIQRCLSYEEMPSFNFFFKGFVEISYQTKISLMLSHMEVQWTPVLNCSLVFFFSFIKFHHYGSYISRSLAFAFTSCLEWKILQFSSWMHSSSNKYTYRGPTFTIYYMANIILIKITIKRKVYNWNRVILIREPQLLRWDRQETIIIYFQKGSDMFVLQSKIRILLLINFEWQLTSPFHQKTKIK